MTIPDNLEHLRRTEENFCRRDTLIDIWYQLNGKS